MQTRIHPLSLTILILTFLVILSAADRVVAARDNQQKKSTPVSAVPQHTVSPGLAVYFESNMGQFDDRVRFVSRTHGIKLFLTDSEAVLLVTAGSGGKQRVARSVTIRAVNGNTAARLSGLDELDGILRKLGVRCGENN